MGKKCKHAIWSRPFIINVNGRGIYVHFFIIIITFFSECNSWLISIVHFNGSFVHEFWLNWLPFAQLEVLGLMLRSRLGDTNDGKHKVDQQHLFLHGRFLDMNLIEEYSRFLKVTVGHLLQIIWGRLVLPFKSFGSRAISWIGRLLSE